MRCWLTVFAFAALACAPESGASGDERCEQGPAIASDAIHDLVESAPSCSVDDDCVRINTDLHCKGVELGNCGTIVHRDAVANWNPDAVCDEIEKLPGRSDVVCSTLPSCVGLTPVCQRGSCTGATR